MSRVPNALGMNKALEIPALSHENGMPVGWSVGAQTTTMEFRGPKKKHSTRTHSLKTYEAHSGMMLSGEIK